MRRLLPLLVLFLLAFQPAAPQKYNFVIILTDDQRWDTLWAMPIVWQRLAGRGVTFANAFTTTPVCCPSRASLLTGQYVHNHHVLNNAIGRSALNEFDTLATNLQRAGYRTGFTGKYLHGYQPGFIPPGWTKFVAGENGGQLLDWWHLRNVTTGGSVAGKAGKGSTYDIDRYLTLHHQDAALSFLDRYGQEPFFLFVSTYAPHDPQTPLPEDMDLFTGYSYRGRGYKEADMSDKPAWLQQAAAMDAGRNEDERHRNVLRSLQPVDRMVGAILDKLAALGTLDRTVIIFASDNGLAWGEHGIYDKGTPYEETIRVPLIVSVPGVPARVESKFALLIDIAPTIYELSGIEYSADGQSLLPLIINPYAEWRKDFLIEAYGYLDWRFNTDGIWYGVRSGRWKFVEWNSEEIELYDLLSDPYELENIAATQPGRVEVMRRRGLEFMYRQWLPVLRPQGNIEGPPVEK